MVREYTGNYWYTFLMIIILSLIFLLYMYLVNLDFWLNSNLILEDSLNTEFYRNFTERIIIIDATFSSFALVFFGALLKTKNKDRYKYFLNEVKLFTLSMKETFLSKIFKRKGPIRTFFRNLIDNIFGMSVLLRLIIIVLITVFQLFLYFFGKFDIIVFFFLLDVFFVLEIIFSVHHYMSFTRNDFIKLYANLYKFNFEQFFLVENNYDLKNDKKTYSACKKEKLKKTWKRRYYKKMKKLLERVNCSTFFELTVKEAKQKDGDTLSIVSILYSMIQTIVINGIEEVINNDDISMLHEFLITKYEYAEYSTQILLNFYSNYAKYKEDYLNDSIVDLLVINTISKDNYIFFISEYTYNILSYYDYRDILGEFLEDDVFANQFLSFLNENHINFDEYLNNYQKHTDSNR